MNAKFNEYKNLLGWLLQGEFPAMENALNEILAESFGESTTIYTLTISELLEYIEENYKALQDFIN